MSLDVCFQLGKALRYSDAEKFLTLYDSLLLDSLVEQDQLVRAQDAKSCKIHYDRINPFVYIHVADSCQGVGSSDIRAVG